MLHKQLLGQNDFTNCMGWVFGFMIQINLLIRLKFLVIRIVF